MKVEMHADDLGATASVNHSILSVWRRNGLHGVSVLANGDAAEEAAIAVNAEPERPLRLVAHLNLSEGRPLAPLSDVPLLVNSRGRLRYNFLGLWLFWLRSAKAGKNELLQQIESEWRAQLQKLRTTFMPRPINAVDGHIHMHMLPFLFPIAVTLAKEFDVQEIRIPCEILHFSLKESIRIGFISNLMKHILLRLLSIPARRIAAQHELRGPDAVAGLLYSGQMSRRVIRAAEESARRRGINWLEIICHPGRAGADEVGRWPGQAGLAGFYRSDARDAERDALIDIADRSQNNPE